MRRLENLGTLILTTGSASHGFGFFFKILDKVIKK
jgi:hypothetical protein